MNDQPGLESVSGKRECQRSVGKPLGGVFIGISTSASPTSAGSFGEVETWVWGCSGESKGLKRNWALVGSRWRWEWAINPTWPKSCTGKGGFRVSHVVV